MPRHLVVVPLLHLHAHVISGQNQVQVPAGADSLPFSHLCCFIF
jgi:hypothetical protein